MNPGELIHADQHGVVIIPPELAARVPEAVARVEADEALYREIRPGTY